MQGVGPYNLLLPAKLDGFQTGSSQCQSTRHGKELACNSVTGKFLRYMIIHICPCSCNNYVKWTPPQTSTFSLYNKTMKELHIRLRTCCELTYGVFLYITLQFWTSYANIIFFPTRFEALGGFWILIVPASYLWLTS